MSPNIIPVISIFLWFLVGFYCEDNDYYEKLIRVRIEERSKTMYLSHRCVQDYGEIIKDQPARIVSLNGRKGNPQPFSASESPVQVQDPVTETRNPCKDDREGFIEKKKKLWNEIDLSIKLVEIRLVTSSIYLVLSSYWSRLNPILSIR